MFETLGWLPALFLIVALFYAMVGFGGGSFYLALLVLAGFHYQQIPVIALICNLIVSLGGGWHFYRAGHLHFKKILPFVMTSVPMAFLGGSLVISKELFCFILGGALLVVAIRLFLPTSSFENPKQVSTKVAWSFGIPIGGVLGFLAGLVGIGGGIFLSPILLLMRWATVKQAAAAASIFIALNSFSGLLGQIQKGSFSWELLLPLGVAVLIGGQIGSRLGAYRVPKARLQQLLGVLILYVAFKLLLEGL